MNKQTFGENMSRKPFWKRSSSKVPGSSISSATHEGMSNVSDLRIPRHKLTFEEFENHTEDAWDASEDDLLRSALAKIKVGSSCEQVQATAQAVIDNHSQAMSSSSPSFASQTNIEASSVNSLRVRNQASQPRKFPGAATRTAAFSPETKVSPVVSKTEAEEGNTLEVNNLWPHQDPDTSIQSKSDITLLPPEPGKAGSAPKAQTIRMPIQPMNQDRENSRIEKFSLLINSDSTDLDKLRKLSWSGIPSPVRAVTWQLLSGYLPVNKDRRTTVLTRKRGEYFKYVEQHYEVREQPMYQTTYHQIHIDIPRTNPLIPLFQQPRVQTIFERLLFVWAVRHPASGYVQGINDLVTPFFVVFLTDQMEAGSDVETFDVTKLPEETLKDMEADTFWCMTKLLDGIQDNYTFAQPGVQTKVNKLKELTKRVDAELHAHLEAEQIEYLQFAFRWMNNLLMREIPLRCTIRLWDTYLAETDGFSDFHLYTCAAFLKLWRKHLLQRKDFQELMLMIQNVPTSSWGEEEIKLLLADAFRLKYTFADAPSHLPNKK